MGIGMGKGKKRTVGERERDLDFIAKLYVRGQSRQKITDALNAERSYSLSDSQVDVDLHLIKTRWLQSSLVDFNQKKMEELARIDHLEQTYWEEWERSRLPKESVLTERTTDKSDKASKTSKGELAPTFSREKVRGRKEQRDGNIVYLQGVERCILMRCKILGLDLSQTVNINWRQEVARAGVDPGETFNDLVGKYVQAIRTSGTEIDDSALLPQAWVDPTDDE